MPLLKVSILPARVLAVQQRPLGGLPTRGLGTWLPNLQGEAVLLIRSGLVGRGALRPPFLKGHPAGGSKDYGTCRLWVAWKTAACRFPLAF